MCIYLNFKPELILLQSYCLFKGTPEHIYSVIFPPGPTIGTSYMYAWYSFNKVQSVSLKHPLAMQ